MIACSYDHSHSPNGFCHPAFFAHLLDYTALYATVLYCITFAHQYCSIVSQYHSDGMMHCNVRLLLMLVLVLVHVLLLTIDDVRCCSVLFGVVDHRAGKLSYCPVITCHIVHIPCGGNVLNNC